MGRRRITVADIKEVLVAWDTDGLGDLLGVQRAKLGLVAPDGLQQQIGEVNRLAHHVQVAATFLHIGLVHLVGNAMALF